MTTRNRPARMSAAETKDAAKAAATLAAAMRKLHGGRWAATIDHGARFVLIRERLPRRAKR